MTSSRDVILILISLTLGVALGSAEANRHRQGNARPPPWPIPSVVVDAGACEALGESCSPMTPEECCSGACGGEGPPTCCVDTDDACTLDAECCSGDCVDDACFQCIAVSDPGCTTDPDCCDGAECVEGTCTLPE